MRCQNTLLVTLLFAANATFAADLGRMFFTPAQRATLDNARKQNIRAEISNDGEQQPTAAPVAQNVSLNGFIKRSDGKNTIWLNSRVINETQPGGMNATINKSEDRVHLNVPDSGRKLDLKVGQSAEIVSGTIEESYLRRQMPKLEGKTLSDGGNTPSGVPKVTPAARAEAVKSESGLQRRPQRGINSDVRDEVPTDDGYNRK